LLLGPKNDKELGYRLRLRCAHLLGVNADGKGPIVRQIGKLYDIRSKIVHSGSAEVLDADLSIIRFFAKKALVAVLTEPHFESMQSGDEFDQWLENSILGA
jgi:Apea-like HEPN